MSRKTVVWTGACILGILAIGLRGDPSLSPGPEGAQWRMTLRVLEGIKEGRPDPAQAVTSSYLRHTLTASIASGDKLADEQNQIRKIFNLKEVRLLTEADLSWGRAREGKASHVFRLNGQEYSVSVSSADVSGRQPFRIQVLERNGTGETSLLDTGFGLPERAENLVVFGFENTRGTPYFLSLHAILLKTEHGGKEDAPKLIKQVDPVYPEDARKKGIEGLVILEGTIDKAGRVIGVRVLKSVPELEKAAVDAVWKWAYEPMMINGKSVEAVFTVTVKFALDKKKGLVQEGVAGGVEGGGKGGVKGGVSGGVYGGLSAAEFEKQLKAFESGAIPCKDDIKPPRLLKQVDPVYPEEARKKRIDGIVILSIKSDETGKVIDAMILRSIPGLDQAALVAVKQWIYEPLFVGGKAVKAIFTVTVRFQLK